MKIGEAAAAAGATPRALRFYEARGLLAAPVRTAAGQRLYTSRDVAVIRLIRELLAQGLTVEDLRECAARLPMLLTVPRPACTPGGIVDRRIAVLTAEISRLTALRDALAGPAT
jgi:DNA-binding transcriptional MerR regulator